VLTTRDRGRKTRASGHSFGNLGSGDAVVPFSRGPERLRPYETQADRARPKAERDRSRTVMLLRLLGDLSKDTRAIDLGNPCLLTEPGEQR
jgi:hypothetical protein